MDSLSRRVPASTVALAGGFAVLALGYLVWVWSDQIAEFGGDSSMYMLMARHYSPFWPHSDALEQMVRGAVYPPLFPFLVGLLGGGMLGAHLLVWACLLMAFWCLYAWLRQEGLGQAQSAWATAVFALMPGTCFLAFNIWSENPYLLLSLVAILCERRAGLAGAAAPRLRLAAAAIAAAGLTRAAALPLLSAYAVHLLLSRPRHWPWLLALAWTPPVLWVCWSKLHHSGASGYFEQWMNVYGQHPFAALATQLQTESRAIRDSWMLAWLGKSDAPPAMVYPVLAAGGICVVGCLWRLARLKFDAIYASLYLVQLLLWPFRAEAPRLSYVVIPVLLAQGLLLLRSNGAVWARTFGHALLAVLSLIMLPGLFLTLNRFAARLPPSLEAARHTADYYSDDRGRAMTDAAAYTGILDNLRDLDHLLPRGECIFAIKPALVTLYSGRLAVAPPQSSVPDKVFEQGLRQCSYDYLMASASPAYPETLYPLQRLGSRATPLMNASTRHGDSVTIYAILVRIDGAAGSGTLR